MKKIALLLAFVTLALTQVFAQVEISGVVIDKTSDQPFGYVSVALLQGDKVLAKKYISVERGAPYSSSETIFFSDVRIMPQIPLAVAVDNYNTDNNSDGVGTH